MDPRGTRANRCVCYVRGGAEGSDLDFCLGSPCFLAFIPFLIIGRECGVRLIVLDIISLFWAVFAGKFM